MLTAKKQLLAALADVLERFSPGAGARAAFESPKVAAHGDFACTAAMQLAKPLKANPRELAERLRTALLAAPAFERWVQAMDIAGPGFLNIRLRAAAKQQVVQEVLDTGSRFGLQPRRGEKVLVEFVSANPTGPLHVGHGRQAALGDALSNLFATQGWDVHREFYYNDAGVQIQTLTHSTQLRAKGFKPGDACWPIDPEDPASKAFYNGDYIQDIANDFLARKTVQADDRSYTASGDVDDVESVRNFAVAYLRHEQDKDLQAFNLQFDAYYLESSLYTSGRVEATVERLIANGKTYDAATSAPILIYPNPLNPEKYVVINSSFTYREYDYLNNARQVPKLPDWAVVDLTQPKTTRAPGGIADAGFFGEAWEWKPSPEKK